MGHWFNTITQKKKKTKQQAHKNSPSSFTFYLFRIPHLKSNCQWPKRKWRHRCCQWHGRDQCSHILHKITTEIPEGLSRNASRVDPHFNRFMFQSHVKGGFYRGLQTISWWNNLPVRPSRKSNSELPWIS